MFIILNAMMNNIKPLEKISILSHRVPVLFKVSTVDSTHKTTQEASVKVHTKSQLSGVWGQSES